jgi:ribosomal-protein-alanine N-acetyltransferase
MELITPRLKIREFMESDYPALREMDCKAEIHTYEREMPSAEETRTKLDEYLKRQQETPRTSFTLAITIHPHDSARGIVKMTRLWEAIREWEVGWMVHPDVWGKGYAGEAAQKVMDWAFNELSTHRIVAFCHADNAASVRVMEKLGMHLDGRLRETRWLNGKWWDELVYSMLEKEWLAAGKLAAR